jgi:hypothetical protein
MPAKKSIRMKKYSFLKAASKRRKKSPRQPWWKTTPALAGATICVLMSAVLIAAYQSSGPQPLIAARPAPRTAMSTFELAPGSAAAAGVEPAPADAPAAAPAAKPNPVTITGCLERSDESFRLKDTEGESAPKARSWKSGFLKKGRAPIEVVDAANRLNLSNHVGERVTVTGTLVDREMRVRSIQRVAASCSLAPKMKA